MGDKSEDITVKNIDADVEITECEMDGLYEDTGYQMFQVKTSSKDGIIGYFYLVMNQLEGVMIDVLNNTILYCDVDGDGRKELN